MSASQVSPPGSSADERPLPDLADRSVLVTGGADGIGRTIAEAFLAQGSRVAVLDIDGEKLAALCVKFPALTAEVADLRDIPVTQAAIVRLVARAGPWLGVNDRGQDAAPLFT